MANTDNHARAAGPTKAPESDDPQARPRTTTHDQAPHLQEGDESTTPPHGDPLLDAAERDKQRESDDEATRPPS